MDHRSGSLRTPHPFKHNDPLFPPRLCWPSGSHLPCETEVCTAKKSGIINHSPGILVLGDEPFFGKSEHVTVILAVGAQGYRECPSRNVLRGSP